MTRLFHPRVDVWEQHFTVKAGVIVGISAIGLTSAYVLGMNTENRVAMRRVLAILRIKPFG